MLASRGTLRAVAAALFAAVGALLFAVSDPVQAGAVLWTVPIAVLAIADGRRGGVAGIAIATVLLVGWVSVDGIDLEPLGWASRIVTFVLIGGLVGHYAEIAGGVERRRVEDRYATELHDTVLQSLVLARYQLPDDHAARPQVDDALQGLKEILSDRVAGADPGDLRLNGPPPAAAAGEAAAP